MLFSFTFEIFFERVCELFSRQQKQAKEEERALKAADKAAEEAAAKARQAAIDEESRKKREDERSKREAAKKAMEEEKMRKEEDRKKRAQEEREREQERERKKKEKEDKTKKEREEKERKAKEEREARLAKEKEEKDRLEKEKADKDKKAKEKAEKEAKEKLAAQQRTAAAASASTLASGSSKGSTRANNAVASSSTATTPVKSNSSSTSSVAAPALQRLPNNSGGSNGNDSPSKKPANKPNPTLVTSPLPPGILGQGARSAVQPSLSRPSHLPSPTPLNAQQPHLPQPPHSAGIMYGHQGPVGMSPRVGNFPPMAYGYGGPNMQHAPPLSPVPARGFNGGSFDPTFNRGIPIGVGVPLGGLPSIPIGPPTKAAKSATQGTASPGLAPGQGRHASGSSNDGSGPGPITRPMAPIARPTAGGGNGDASSGSGSPNRRSPSPSRVLGSSALAADDDEVVSAHGPRRAAVIGIGTIPIGGGPGGQNWGSASPRSALSEANLRSAPWTASAFSSIRSPIGPNNHLHQLHHPGPVSPSLWGNTPSNGNGENWHPQSPGFFSGPPYINHNAAASSTPHTST